MVSLFASCEKRGENPIRDEVGIMNMERPEDSYNYHVYPGTEEWAKLSTGDEMPAAQYIFLFQLDFQLDMKDKISLVKIALEKDGLLLVFYMSLFMSNTQIVKRYGCI
ncbi:MAG: hypothetical protein LBC19_06100 [Tannerella sp.]|jgi:hypothetical protein|nr:hypothetical protein [Tannerella sp.]